MKRNRDAQIKKRLVRQARNYTKDSSIVQMLDIYTGKIIEWNYRVGPRGIVEINYKFNGRKGKRGYGAFR